MYLASLVAQKASCRTYLGRSTTSTTRGVGGLPMRNKRNKKNLLSKKNRLLHNTEGLDAYACAVGVQSLPNVSLSSATNQSGRLSSSRVPTLETGLGIGRGAGAFARTFLRLGV